MKFSDLTTQDKPDKPIKQEKQKEQKIVIVTEPGDKIPIGNFQQIGQWCDVCEDVEMHAYNKQTKRIRCITCKNTKQL